MNTENKIEDGGPAFPEHAGGMFGEHFTRTRGMSLRDWFAGQEVISTDETLSWPVLEALVGPRPSGNWDSNPMEWFNWSNKWQAKVKYARADAMIEAGRVK